MDAGPGNTALPDALLHLPGKGPNISENAVMHRRFFLAGCLALIPAVEALAAANKRFVFKIKTKSGGIVGNIVIEAKDIEAAKVKLKKRYPDCEILEGHEK